MDRYPRFPPPPIAVPQHLEVASKRNQPQVAPAMSRYPFQLAHMQDAASLTHAVAHDPHGMFAQLTELLLQKQALENQVTHLMENLDGAHKDFESRRKNYDTLLELGVAKQLILWKHISRLQGGLYDGAGLEGAKERFEQRELEREREQVAKESGNDDIKSPEKESLLHGNESPGTAVSVLSDMASEGGSSSPVRSVAGSTATLFDPTVDAFIPGRSPLKYHSERSDTAINLAYPPPFSNQVSNTQIAAYKAALPPHLINICPYSMTHEYNCPRPSCRRVKLCAKLNGPASACHDSKCPYLHEYRTCGEQLLGNGCHFTRLEKTDNLRKNHANKRVHGGEGEDAETWNVRTIMAALIPAHLDGRY